MATLRKWLNELAFDWEGGQIVYQPVDDKPPGWGSGHEACSIDRHHPIIDHDFDDGYGGPECPRIIAKDDHAIYFPAQYDGSTWLNKVMIDIAYYVDPNHETPYPGG